ncbi:MAG: cyclic nucleotide-binding domain-containing protein [Elusimicrobiales bacterium]|nr:cyclic nucleotide-binding domain-containing protein [Elusimicrobiales bacterium]
MNKLPLTDADTLVFTRMVKKINFFASMNMGLLEKILSRINYYQYGAGEKVCRQGDPGDSFFVVAEGRLKVSVREAFLFSRTLATFGPGDCFGEMALLERKPRNATVACEESSKVFVLAADHFDQVLAENPAFKQEIKKLAADRQFELDHKK